MYVAGFERGVRPIGDWSIAISLSRCSSPSIRSCAPGFPFAAVQVAAESSTRMSVTSELLPEPDTPVMHTSPPSRISTSTFFRLLWRAPTIRSCLPLGGRVWAGTSIFSWPLRYWPVRLRFSRAIARASPRATTSPAADARAGTEVDDVVGRPHRVFVVLDDDDRVSHVAQPGERVEQPIVVARMQADRRLVQNVEHAHQPAADLPGQPDALRLAAGERGRGAVERQIIEAHIDQEPQPPANLFEHLDRDRLPRVVVGELAEELHRVGNAQAAHLGQRARGALGKRRMPAGDLDGPSLRVEPGSFASGARQHAHVLLELPLLHLLCVLRVTGQELRHDPFELAAVLVPCVPPRQVNVMCSLPVPSSHRACSAGSRSCHGVSSIVPDGSPCLRSIVSATPW